MHTDRWEIHIDLFADGDSTTATARLRGRDIEIAADGTARRLGGDRDVPEVGAELAVARALRALSDRLIDDTLSDLGDLANR